MHLKRCHELTLLWSKFSQNANHSLGRNLVILCAIYNIKYKFKSKKNNNDVSKA